VSRSLTGLETTSSREGLHTEKRKKERFFVKTPTQKDRKVEAREINLKKRSPEKEKLGAGIYTLLLAPKTEGSWGGGRGEPALRVFDGNQGSQKGG